jgi:hypothetical protein
VLVNGTWFALAESLAGPILLGIFSAVITFAADILLKNFTLAPLSRLAIVALVGGGFTGFFFVLLQHRLTSQPVFWLLREAAGRLPKPLRRLIRV